MARDHEGLQPGQHLAQQLQVVVDLALAVATHVAAGAPEDEHGALADVEQVVAVAQDPLDAGMRDDPQAGAVAHVAPVATRGGVVHADDTFCLVNLGALPAAQQLPRARHQGAVPAVHFQGLEGEGERLHQRAMPSWHQQATSLPLRAALFLLLPPLPKHTPDAITSSGWCQGALDNSKRASSDLPNTEVWASLILTDQTVISM